MKFTTLRAVIIGTAIILGTNTVFAQQHQQPGRGMMMQPGFSDQMMGPGMMRGGMMGRNCPMMGMMMGGGKNTFAAGRIAFLKAELAITEDQNELFEAYTAALKNNLEDMRSMHQQMTSMNDAKSTVERLDIHLAMMEGRTEQLKAIKGPLTALYAALSDEQKNKADEMLVGMGCMM